MIDREDRETTEAIKRFRVRWPRIRGSAGDHDQSQAGRVPQPAAARLRVAPGIRDLWSRFLLARLTWILIMTVLVTASAGGFLVLQKPMYKSQATVAIYPAAGATSAVQPFVMGTEKGVASSGAVLAIASQSLLIPISKLQSGLSITVPVDSDLLVISYSDPNPQLAQSVAEAIAQAYVAYRTTSLGPPTSRTGSASTQALQAAVVTDATLPTTPDTPNPLLTIGIALILGLCLGIGLALILDWLDDGLRGPIDLQAQSHMPVLAQIPALDRKRHRMVDGLISVEHPESPIAAAYGDLRTRVLQAASLRRGKTLLVTSPGREDKSEVAANLAGAVALSGRRVVLVCADLRGGNAALLFGLGDTLGVTSVVTGETELADTLATTDVHGLEVLASGPPSPDPSSVVHSRAFKALLKRLRTGADLVVIDAPPLLASADAAAMAEEADMVLLVADSRISSRADVRAATQELQRTRDRMIGCVLAGAGTAGRLGAPSRRPATSGKREPAHTDDGRTAASDLNVPPAVDERHTMRSTTGNGEGSWDGDVHETPEPDAIADRPTAESGPWLASAPDLIGEAAGLATIPARNGTPDATAKPKRRTETGRNGL